MSASSTTPPLTPAEPSTPPPTGPSVRITLPTPPSFARRQRSVSTSVPSPPSKQASEEESGESTSSGSENADVVSPFKIVEWKKSHGRSVSFNLPAILSPISPRDTSRNVKEPSASPGLYRIPQKSPDYVESSTVPLSETPVLDAGDKKRRVPPRPLSLSPASQRFVGPMTGVSSTTRHGPMTVPAHGSRWSSTAAARGLSIAPSLAKQRHSTSSASALGSIWSANLAGLGASSGWISPALASARSTGGSSARTRGLTVAVLNSGKEVLIETLPTPGLGRTLSDRSDVIAEEKEEEMEMLKDELASPTPKPKASSPAPSTARSPTKKPREIILCRYYHTPDLTCTSRPCRFVHDLASVGITEASISDYNMKSPTTANLPSAVLDRRTGDSPDFTSGTFAAYQAEARRKTLTVKDVDEKGIVPGEKVVVASENGTEVEGMVFLMSGGGKGPAGRGKAKFKTVACKEYAEGHCPYGAHCSFIHDEQPSVVAPPKSAIPNLGPILSKPLATSTATTKADRRRTFDPTLLRGAVNAWLTTPSSPGPINLSMDLDAVERHQQNLSAFAPPYRETPIEVNVEGKLIPTTPGLPSTSGVSRGSVPEVRFKLEPAPAMVRAKSSDSTSSKRSAWSKGPPAHLKTVTIDSSPIIHQTLAVPVSATSMFGTGSDPATPWDPAIRALRIAEAEEEAAQEIKRDPEYPPTASYATVAPDYVYTFPDGPQLGPMSYPYSAPAYPWGMPMSPVNVAVGGMYDPAPQIPGGLGVMWTPTGWAVQDAAMKMALFQAENGEGWRKGQAKGEYQPKTYWRTKKCKFYAEGSCPHGDTCTYIHEGPVPQESKPKRSSKKNHQTQPCKFYNSAAGCLNNDNDCAFLHTLVVPTSAQLVAKPRPWRTRPCRHFQVGRCRLGDSCHFAHQYDGTGIGGREEGDGGVSEGGHALTEESLRRSLAESGMRERVRDEDEDSEDDLEIVTEDTSTLSPPHSVRAVW